MASYLYMRSFVADGNFKADHLKQKDDSSDVWLTSGEAFMTNETRYQMHLEKATESKYVRHSNFRILLIHFF
jgi:hypothetical protein